MENINDAISEIPAPAVGDNENDVAASAPAIKAGEQDFISAALRGPTILWDAQCPICHKAATFHFLGLPPDHDFKYVFVQHPASQALLKKLTVSDADAT